MKKILVLMVPVAMLLPGCGEKQETKQAPQEEQVAVQTHQEQQMAPEQMTKAVEPLQLKGGKIHHLEEYTTAENDEAKLESIIAGNAKVIVDFFAEWCGPCKALGAKLETVAKKNTDIVIVKVNVEKFNALATKNDISSIPVMIFYKDGKKVDRVTGGVDLKTLNAAIKEKLA